MSYVNDLSVTKVERVRIIPYAHVMGVEDPAQRVWSAIATLVVSNEQHGRFQDVCRQLDLPHPGALKLLLLLDDPSDPPAMGDVARLLNCDASYVTSLVDALEAPGFAERRTSERDRRVKTIHLTGAGMAARQRAHELLSVPPPRMDRLTARETETLARLLEKLVAER